ncbi:hypothetical protein Nepgr_012563 [Nepenthes gracilis]|uniref:Uncharacterized protein n=1 Tax=Nepenthes gracilis TaxID=150966 RepID=A0AAD3XMX0_NEPGR|nr:hypothetical protein Nepgr_012563 [Nepenthes gracilis]
MYVGSLGHVTAVHVTVETNTGNSAPQLAAGAVHSDGGKKGKQSDARCTPVATGAPPPAPTTPADWDSTEEHNTRLGRRCGSKTAELP